MDGVNDLWDDREEDIMAGMKRAFVVGAVLVAVAGPAYAFQCPGLVAKIDKSLAGADISAAQLAEIKQLRDDGEAMHKAGNHGDAVEVLNEVLARLEDAGG